MPPLPAWRETQIPCRNLVPIPIVRLYLGRRPSSAFRNFSPMSKAHADPAELRRFAHDLMRFSGDMRTMLTAMNGRMHTLEQAWQDQEQRKFAAAFEETTRAMGKFLAATEDHARFVSKKAELIEAYLRAQ